MVNRVSSLFKNLISRNAVQNAEILRSLKAKANAKRTLTEKIADAATQHFGSMGFLAANAFGFVIWILIHTGSFTAIKAFDPYPFNLLTMIVSLEAIILATLVLISQNRASKVDDIREETHLQINLIAEKEITKTLKMVTLLLEKQGVNLDDDPELKKMLEPIDEDEVEKMMEQEMRIKNVA